MSEEKENIFLNLNAVNVNQYVEKKKTGSTELSYLSWAWAWKAVKERYPDATYRILKFENNLPYVFDENTGYMVFTEVKIDGVTHEMWLPVMDNSNKAMKSESYTYDTRNRKGITVEKASMFDVNKTIMRCLVKNLAMFGLGLYLYAGEDLPMLPKATKEQRDKAKKLVAENARLAKMTQQKAMTRFLTNIQYAGKFEDIDVETCEALIQTASDALVKMKAKVKEEQQKEESSASTEHDETINDQQDSLFDPTNPPL
ncbi:DUF1071 domain-containing protein [Enterococcus hirae]|uniref:Sak single strand annealing protein n=1 Tax=Enterococcus hirae TaxID=1354 RepID=UPI001A0D9744|nr:DUF1071 domain-containing protein [Enterococcus hirae]